MKYVSLIIAASFSLPLAPPAWAAEWFKPGFTASGWQDGAAPFGTQELPIARKPNTQWTSADIWLRREFDWPADMTATPVLWVHHDEDVEIYVNGVLAGKAGGFSSEYEELAITPEGVAAFKPGKNLLAVHCHQTTGGQYIDVGIFTETSGVK